MTRGLFTLSSAGSQTAGNVASRAGRLAHEGSAAEGQAFIAGDENALVRVLAAAVEQEKLRYNPIVLTGPTGVGKSTVAQALAERRQAALGLTNCIRTTGADLARGLAHAVEVRATDDFRRRHHRCDLLVVDDCQGLGNKLAAQGFLATAIDALVGRGSLVIVTLPQSPLATAKLTPALASRLSAGLVVTLAHPGYEARREYVRRESQRVGLALAAADIERLAGQPRKPVERFVTAAKLRSAILKIAAKHPARTSKLPAQATPAGDAGDERAICRQVCSAAARHFAVTPGEIRGKSRSRSIAEARAVAMYVAKKLTGASYGKIGKQFGGRDHTTVLHACRKMAAALENDALLRRLTEDLARQAVAAADH